MSIALTKGTPVTLKSAITVALICIGYLVVSYFLVGYKSDQLVLIGIFCSLYFSSGITRKFVLGFSIFIVYWIIFDYMKAFPNYNYNPVHIADLYNTEKHLFGIQSGNLLLTPNEYWWIHHISTLDVLTGIFYLCWIPVPLAFAAYLFFTNRNQFLRFSLTFVLVNFLGFIVYYTYPAAPPWYIHFNGFRFHAHTPGNTAGLARFDAFFGVNIFKNIYAKGSNVFAAMPSLHSSYPLIVFYYGLKNRLGIMNFFFAIVMVGIWFAAVYTSHHYVMDVMAGITCATLGIALFNFLSAKWIFLRNALFKYEALIR